MLDPIAAPKPANPFMPGKTMRLPPAHNINNNIRKAYALPPSDAAIEAEVDRLMRELDAKKN